MSGSEKIQLIVAKTLSIKLTEKRFKALKSGRHFEFKKVQIPPNAQERLRCGDIIYANGPDGQSKPLEFLTTSTFPHYAPHQVDIIVRVI